MQIQQTTVSQLPLPPVLPPARTVEPATFWGWALHPRWTPAENLAAALRYYDGEYGGRLVSVRCRSVLAAALLAAPLPVIPDDRVAANLLLFEREAVS
jgi:hypothetical protein